MREKREQREDILPLFMREREINGEREKHHVYSENTCMSTLDNFSRLLLSYSVFSRPRSQASLKMIWTKTISWLLFFAALLQSSKSGSKFWHHNWCALNQKQSFVDIFAPSSLFQPSKFGHPQLRLDDFFLNILLLSLLVQGHVRGWQQKYCYFINYQSSSVKIPNDVIA